MASTNALHTEERSQSASRRAPIPGTAVVFLLVGALLAACSPQETRLYPPARHALGAREALHAGHWRGQVGMTEVDFAIEQVSTAGVSVRVSGTVLRQANRSLENSGVENYFYDRPRVCKLVADGRTFDCTRYTDMHIDNGLLCGVYVAPDQAYRPCLEPAL